MDGGWQVDVVKFKLNEALVEWAYDLAKTSPCLRKAVQEFSKIYADYPNATKPPFVMIGGSLSSSLTGTVRAE